MRRARGFSLVEVLVAMAVLSLVMAVTLAAVGTFTRAQREVAAAAELRGKLRRAAEVLGQEVRGAAFGALADSPVVTGKTSISFVLLAGPAGLAVLGDPDFASRDYFDVYASTAPDIDEGDEVTLINNTGDARNFEVSDVESLGNNTWRIYHAGCTNELAYTASTLAFATKRVALDYDEDEDTVTYTEGGTTKDLLYGVTAFRIRYQYLKNGSTEVLDPSGFNPDDAPPYRRFTDADGNEYELRGVALYATSERKVANHTAKTTVQAPVALTTADTIFVSRVEVCR